MNSLEIDELTLIKGNPILMSDGSCFIHQLQMGEIADLTLGKFYEYLNLFSTLDEELKNDKNDNIVLYDILIANCEIDLDMRSKIETGLEIFTKEKNPRYDEERKLFVLDFEYDSKLTKDNFDEFRKILRIIYRMDEMTKDDKPMSEAERKMKEKFEKARAKLAATKSKEGKKNGPTLKDLIIGLHTGTHLPLNQIWHLSFYSFYEHFYSMQRKEKYDITLQSLMAGADSKKNKLVHWLSEEEKE